MTFAIKNAVVMILIILMMHLLLCNALREPTAVERFDTIPENDAVEESKHRELLQFVMQQDATRADAPRADAERTDDHFAAQGNVVQMFPSVDKPDMETPRIASSSSGDVLPYDNGSDTFFASCSPVNFSS